MVLNAASHNMIQQQIRTWGVLDPKVLDIFKKSHRDQFVSSDYKSLAYTDAAIPIGCGQVTLPPKIVGRILQNLELKTADKVLEIGTGTGYITSLLSHLAKKIITVEINPELAKVALQHFNELHLGNITLEIGDGTLGWPSEGPYDAILLTGSLTKLPKEFGNQLANGGRLIAFLGQAPVMSAVLVTRINKDFCYKTLFETLIPPLTYGPQHKSFKI